MITVNVNNTAHTFNSLSNLQDLLTQLDISETGIAVAVNNQIISKSDWNRRELGDGENILIIRATQGG
ncbi:thiamine biosynthesis protein [Salegentibacter salinarum]|uniref:Thiamine biosynthesis protein n=1 Tax=Salegentibacter salinarum TaxID=447422 RepID=A0A2N0U4J8_9FLAO|nr:sulfur carrier protein ThiS [Salegentibacter salinarum]PKD21933.1 thiamine biosynthesis protein [Salegentibacter salinarum]SKB35448.1 sulfur carrier protein [Salegentibacter salinarum]